MAVAFVQTVTPWQAATSPSPSGSFTPTAGHSLVGACINGGNTTNSVSGSASTFSILTPPGQHADLGGDNDITVASVSCAGGAQTCSFSASSPNLFGWLWEYSGATTVTSDATDVTHPGTGSGAIQGAAVTVPTGAILLALCVDVFAASVITSPSGTNRGSGSLAGVSYCATEYAGSGASITPSFTSASGPSELYVVLQWLVSPASGTNENLTAQTATFTEGTIARAVSTALTGQTATFSEGTISAAAAYGLTGQSATFTEGVLTPALAKSLTGQTASFSLGTITPSVSYGLTGQTATFAEGTITPSQGTVANLTAQTATFSVGTITPAITYGVTGQTATFAEGLLSPQASYGLTGQTSTFTEGALSGEIDYALTGLTATFAEGTITAQAGGDVNRSLTGLSASFSVGLITVTGGDQTVSADTHDPLPKRRKRQFDDGAQTQVIRESQLKPKKAKAVARAIEIAEPPEVPAYIENPEDEEELLALLQDQDEQLISSIELATHLLRTLH